MELKFTMTGVDSLIKNFKGSVEKLEKEIDLALRHSIAMTGTEIQRRTPVATIATSGYVGGYLRSSIGGEGGYSFVKGLSAGIGTNVVYAYAQESHGEYRHAVGEAHYTEKGLAAATPYIESQFGDAMTRLSESLIKE